MSSWEAFERQRRGRLLLLTTKGDAAHLDSPSTRDDILLLGRESAGVPDAVHQAATHRLRIPMRPGLRSLNVALAAAMVLGEALRQTERISGMSPDEQRRERQEAVAWFETLRDRICAAFEALEDEYDGPLGDQPAGRFERKAWQRPPDASGETTAAAASSRSCAAGSSRRSGSMSRPSMAASARSSARQIPGRRGLRRQILGERHQPGRPSALAQGAGGAYEHAPHRDQQGLVRRRRGSDAHDCPTRPIPRLSTPR